MIQEIKYSGFTATPSDYESTDGELAMSLGLVPEDGALKPVLPPKELFTLDETTNVVFIHKTSNFTHYIVLDSSNKEMLFTYGDTGHEPFYEQQLHVFQSSTVFYGFNAVGNTFMALTDSGIHYFLWKEPSEEYSYLGTHMPECQISFGLTGEMVRYDEFQISFDGWSEREFPNRPTENIQKQITDQVLAQVNLFIATESTGKGKFLYPFLVRYAYRLYDGSLVMHSSPVLMVASSDCAPVVFVYELTGKDGMINAAKLRVCGVLHQLDYAVIDKSCVNELRLWKDVIKSVDIFISAPIYTYDQSGTCGGFSSSGLNGSYCVSKVHARPSVSDYHQKFEFLELCSAIYGGFPKYKVILPRKTEEEVKEAIRSCAQFYFLRSLKIEELSTERKTIEVKEDYLQTLVTRELMTDDYDSHDTLIPAYSFIYNSRVNVANMKKRLYGEYNAGAMLQFTDGYKIVSPGEGTDPYARDGTVLYTVDYHIRQDGKEIVVKGGGLAMSQYFTPLLFLYYPNVNAYKAVVSAQQPYPPSKCYEVNLEPHDFLNGAFYFGGWDNPREGGETDAASTDEERTIGLPNKIYTSEVNNPFYFPVLGINTIGTGTIQGISSAAKALSQGQFGQFPLYAFSTDGVWALEVSATGTYSARQPITRDICINPSSIMQIDSAVLFTTDRGIMLISGSETICLSDSINSRDLFSISDLPKAGVLVGLFNQRASGNKQISIENISLLPFRDFLLDCRMIYDYTGQRIIVYNPSVSYAYVYSLKSKAWGMMHSDITDNVNSYPDALAMVSGGKLVNFSLSDATGITALVITRPFKLGTADVLKTADTIIRRGFFKKDHVSQILYGSCDLFNWHIVWSSTDKYLRGFRGTPYKYFRLALICKLDKAESIYGCSVQFTPRFTDKPR